MLTYVFILLGGPSQASARPTVYTSSFGCTFKGRRASRSEYYTSMLKTNTLFFSYILKYIHW